MKRQSSLNSDVVELLAKVLRLIIDKTDSGVDKGLHALLAGLQHAIKRNQN